VTNNISARQIWNLDETSFCLVPSRIRVVGETANASHRATSGPGKENITVPVAANVTSLLLRFHADEIVSHPSVRVIPISQNKIFEVWLLEHVKQMPHVKTGRKQICRGAKVMSGERSERMKETE
jgi:hypothetical protein